MSGNYDYWLSRVPDPHEYDERQDEEPPCPHCEALPGEPCALFCSCEACDRQRQREMDEREGIEDGKEVA